MMGGMIDQRLWLKTISAGDAPVSPGVLRYSNSPLEKASVEKSPEGASLRTKFSMTFTVATVEKLLESFCRQLWASIGKKSDGDAEVYKILCDSCYDVFCRRIAMPFMHCRINQHVKGSCLK